MPKNKDNKVKLKDTYLAAIPEGVVAGGVLGGKQLDLSVDGYANNYYQQLAAMLNYQVNPNLTLGVGAQYDSKGQPQLNAGLNYKFQDGGYMYPTNSSLENISVNQISKGMTDTGELSTFNQLQGLETAQSKIQKQQAMNNMTPEMYAAYQQMMRQNQMRYGGYTMPRQYSVGGDIAGGFADAGLLAMDTIVSPMTSFVSPVSFSKTIGAEYSTQAGKDIQRGIDQVAGVYSQVAPEVGGAVLDYYVPGLGTAVKNVTYKGQDIARKNSNIRKEDWKVADQIQPAARAAGNMLGTAVSMGKSMQGDEKTGTNALTADPSQVLNVAQPSANSVPSAPAMSPSYGMPQVDMYGNMPNTMTAAMGGLLPYANGGLMANGGLAEINAGGTHEQNPNGGVAHGPNASVEEGETVMQNEDMSKFVFSERIFVQDKTGRDTKKSYADASKDIKRKYKTAKGEDRYGDYAAEKAMKQELKALAASQEEVKQAQMAALQKQMEDLSGITAADFSQSPHNPAPELAEPSQEQMMDPNMMAQMQQQQMQQGQQQMDPAMMQAMGGMIQYGNGGTMLTQQPIVQNPDGSLVGPRDAYGNVIQKVDQEKLWDLYRSVTAPYGAPEGSRIPNVTPEQKEYWNYLKTINPQPPMKPQYANGGRIPMGTGGFDDGPNYKNPVGPVDQSYRPLYGNALEDIQNEELYRNAITMGQGTRPEAFNHDAVQKEAQFKAIMALSDSFERGEINAKQYTEASNKLVGQFPLTEKQTLHDRKIWEQVMLLNKDKDEGKINIDEWAKQFDKIIIGEPYVPSTNAAVVAPTATAAPVVNNAQEVEPQQGATTPTTFDHTAMSPNRGKTGFIPFVPGQETPSTIAVNPKYQANPAVQQAAQAQAQQAPANNANNAATTNTATPAQGAAPVVNAAAPLVNTGGYTFAKGTTRPVKQDGTPYTDQEIKGIMDAAAARNGGYGTVLEKYGEDVRPDGKARYGNEYDVRFQKEIAAQQQDAAAAAKANNPGIDRSQYGGAPNYNDYGARMRERDAEIEQRYNDKMPGAKQSIWTGAGLTAVGDTYALINAMRPTDSMKFGHYNPEEINLHRQRQELYNNAAKQKANIDEFVRAGGKGVSSGFGLSAKIAGNVENMANTGAGLSKSWESQETYNSNLRNQAKQFNIGQDDKTKAAKMAADGAKQTTIANSLNSLGNKGAGALKDIRSTGAMYDYMKIQEKQANTADYFYNNGSNAYKGNTPTSGNPSGYSSSGNYQQTELDKDYAAGRIPQNVYEDWSRTSPNASNDTPWRDEFGIQQQAMGGKIDPVKVNLSRLNLIPTKNRY